MTDTDILVIIGAILLDVIPFEPIASTTTHTVVIAAAYAFGFVLVALPLLSLHSNLASFAPIDDMITFVTAFVMALLLAPLARNVSKRLQAEQAIDTAKARRERQVAAMSGG